MDMCVGSDGLSFSVGVGKASVKISTSGGIGLSLGYRSVPLPPSDPIEFSEYVRRNSIPDKVWEQLISYVEDIENKDKLEPLETLELFLFYGMINFMQDIREYTPESDEGQLITSEVCIGADGRASFSIGYDNRSIKATTARAVSFAKY